MNDDPNLFSGRVIRVASGLDRAAGWYRDAFVLGMSSKEFDLESSMILIEGIDPSWLVDEYEFTDQPKETPALIYAREIETSADTAEFRSGYFEALNARPDHIASLYPEEESMPWGSKGATFESRRYFLEMLGPSIGPEGDVWRDVSRSFENYSARALIRAHGKYEESLWFAVAGIDSDPGQALSKTLRNRAQSVGGELVALDGPHPIVGPPWPQTGMILANLYRNVEGDSSVFKERFVTLQAW